MMSLRNRISSSVASLALVAGFAAVGSAPAVAATGGCTAQLIESSTVENAHYARSYCTTLTNGNQQRARLYVNFGTGDYYGLWEGRASYYSKTDKHRYGGGAGFQTR